MSTGTTDYPPPCRVSQSHRPRALLELALQLWGEGHELPAAVVARAALERHLASVCERHPEFIFRRRTTTRGYLGFLRRVGAIADRDSNRVEQVHRLASKAAHGHPVPYGDLAHVIQATRVIVDNWSIQFGRRRRAIRNVTWGTVVRLVEMFGAVTSARIRVRPVLLAREVSP